MKLLFRRLKFAWDYFVRGRRPSSSVPSDLGYPAPDETLMEFVEGMFSSHGAQAFRSGSWVAIDGGRLFARADHFNLNDAHPPGNLVLQTDFAFVTPDGLRIIESFAGIGIDVRSALMDACKSFQDSSFHALFVTLLDRPCDHHVDREIWTIAGIPRAITLGLLRTRGSLPLDLWPPVFEGIQQQVEATPLPSGLHWVRYFYANIPGNSPTIEVLVDNEPNENLMSQVSSLPWPPCDAFYSARLFFTIRDPSV